MPQTPARRAAGRSPDVASLVRLHHRRRGWAWVGTGSAIGFVVYLAIGVDLTGTAGILSVVAVFVLLALAVAGLVVTVADTSRIHRADAAVQVSAKGSVSHYPLYAHAHRYPPRHHGSWVFGVVMLVAGAGIALALLPAQVNSWAYLAGAEHQDTFNPVSYGQACRPVSRGGGCSVVTEGYLSSSSGAHVTWGSQVPLGQPFAVRDPLWAWGSGRSLISGTGPAIGNIIAGLFFDGLALLLLYILLVMMREKSAAPVQRRPVPAGAHPGAARRTHPARGHPPGGAPRRTRRS
jgi:hypothetical protein